MKKKVDEWKTQISGELTSTAFRSLYTFTFNYLKSEKATALGIVFLFISAFHYQKRWKPSWRGACWAWTKSGNCGISGRLGGRIMI